MTLSELHKAVKQRENEARARIKVHLSKKWYWRETGDECDLTSAGNCEMLLGVTGDAVSFGFLEYEDVNNIKNIFNYKFYDFKIPNSLK